MAEAEQKHLAGLTFRTSEKKKIKGDEGEVAEKYVASERKLLVADILSQKDNGDSFTVVTKDGKKYTVPKTPGRGDAGKEG